MCKCSECTLYQVHTVHEHDYSCVKVLECELTANFNGLYTFDNMDSKNAGMANGDKVIK